MQLTVQGKQIDVGDALRTHVSEKMEEINNKFFNRAVDATVTFSREGHGHGVYRVNISIRVGKNIMVVAEDEAGDPYPAFDSTADRIAKQLRRYKSKLRDHHERMDDDSEAAITVARDYTIAESADEDDGIPQGEDPVVIAEMSAKIEKLSVSEAVMRMDLAGLNALLFRNAKHGNLNLVYRRTDGNVGWVDTKE